MAFDSDGESSTFGLLECFTDFQGAYCVRYPPSDPEN